MNDENSLLGGRDPSESFGDPAARGWIQGSIILTPLLIISLTEHVLLSAFASALWFPQALPRLAHSIPFLDTGL